MDSMTVQDAGGREQGRRVVAAGGATPLVARSRRLRFVSAFHGLFAFANVAMLVSGSFFTLLGRTQFVYRLDGKDRFTFSGQTFTLPEFLALSGTAMAVIWLWRSLRQRNRRETALALVLSVLTRLAEGAVMPQGASALSFTAVLSVLLVAWVWPELDEPSR